MKNNTKIGVVGLGYVGIPLAIAFDKKYDVIGFDLNEQKINLYKEGIDVTKEVGNDAIKNSNIEFTADSKRLSECNRIIIAVPTPVNEDKTPDLNPVKSASQLVGENMSGGTIVIYESTVYPGLTEEICMPILEQYSEMKCGEDFKVAYSPERVNPGDKVHKIENIVKIVSGMDDETLNEVARLYESILNNGVYRASSIKVAEAAKIIENCQRDVNIAFANEMAMICNNLNIDTNDVFDAASSKWNFINFRPGLVGGHCIGVDPYYLINKSEQFGYEPKILQNARLVNENIVDFIAENITKKFSEKNINLSDANVEVLGITFKENVNDIRNSKAIDLVKKLKEKNINVYVQDPNANIDLVKKEYGITVEREFNSKKVDLLVVAVGHDQYKQIQYDNIYNMLNENKIVFDIKNVFDNKKMKQMGFDYWRL